jgi:hypothetical protein
MANCGVEVDNFHQIADQLANVGLAFGRGQQDEAEKSHNSYKNLQVCSNLFTEMEA